MKVVIAGKNRLATEGLKLALNIFSEANLIAVPSVRSSRESSAFPDLAKEALDNGVRVASLAEVQKEEDILFLSLEFDKIVRPQEFASKELVNLHLSNLPAYRGCNTSFWPILNGETHAGVSLHLIDSGVDSGPLIASRKFEIPPQATSDILHNMLIDFGVALLKDELANLVEGDYSAAAQPPGGSYYPRSMVNFSEIDLSVCKSVLEFDRMFRALYFPLHQYPKYGGRDLERFSLVFSESQTSMDGSDEGLKSERLKFSDGEVQIFFR